MIIIKLFALLRDKAGTGELAIPAGPSTVQEVLQKVSRLHPALKDTLSCGRLLLSVNREFAQPDAPVRDGDEIGLMPPFSGGSTLPNVRIQEGPFSLDQEVERVKQASSSIGAIVTFVGTTRDISKERRVSKLDFEHYPGMAEKTLEDVRTRAISEFGAVEVSIIHRIGTMPVGENIVLIVAAAVHREEAFQACRFCIDELKRITPIWKRETTPEGESWVEEHP